MKRALTILKAHPARTPYQKGMLLWTAHHVEGLMSETERKQAIKELLALPGGSASCAGGVCNAQETSGRETEGRPVA